MNEADALQLEILLIHLYGRIDIKTGNLRNRTSGGDGVSGYKHSDESRKQMSITRQNMSEITRQKMAESKKGNQNALGNKGGHGRRSDEVKKKMSDAQKFRFQNNPKIGKKLSQETKDKISKSNKGHHYSPKTEFKKKIL
jgi:hypothetical protein